MARRPRAAQGLQLDPSHQRPGGPWSTPQRQGLQRIAAQTKANLVVDLEALDDPDLIFRREGGGFTRLNRLVDGQLVFAKKVSSKTTTSG